jgi:hypothetical protein
LPWSVLFSRFLESLSWNNNRLYSRLGYSLHDRMMFSEPKTFGKHTYTKGLWTAWSHLRKNLKYRIPDNSLPSHWWIGDVINILPYAKVLGTPQRKILVDYYRKLHVVTIKDMWDPQTNCWISLDTRIQRLRNAPQWIHRALLVTLIEIQRAADTSNAPEDYMSNWYWACSKMKHKSLKISSAQAYHLLLNSELNFQTYNKWWFQQDTKDTWKKRYKLLWNIDIAPRGRTFLWKIIVNGHYNKEQALHIKH